MLYNNNDKNNNHNNNQTNNGGNNPAYDMRHINERFYINAQDMQNSEELSQDMPSTGGLVNKMTYPDIYYKVLPFIMSACDQMNTYEPSVLSQDMVDHMTDTIYDDVCQMYPNLTNYADENYNDNSNYNNYNNGEESESSDPYTDAIALYPGMYGRRFRNRGSLRDLISILLLSEIFRRRRRY